jgi:hypothetical protein
MTCSLRGGDCPELGCANRTAIVFRTASGAWTPGAYAVEWAIDGTRGSCTLSVPEVPSANEKVLGHCSGVDVSWSLIPESCCATLTRGNATGGFCMSVPGQFHVELVTGAPHARIDLTLSRDGVELARNTVSPNYTALQPNGPSCGSGCQQSSSDLLVDTGRDTAPSADGSSNEGGISPPMPPPLSCDPSLAGHTCSSSPGDACPISHCVCAQNADSVFVWSCSSECD